VKVTHLSHADLRGGAARFAYRTHEAVSLAGVESRITVSSKRRSDENVSVLGHNNFESTWRGKAKFCQELDRWATNFERTSSYTYKSPGLIGGVSARHLNRMNHDVVHAHWINGGLISIKQFGLIKSPIVWSILDMWPFMGAEHYSSDIQSPRWIAGFIRENRIARDRGIDICKLAWRRKRKYWGNMQIVVPGKWLGNLARESLLFNESPVQIIPPALDTLEFSPLEKSKARKSLGIPLDTFVIGYGGGFSGRKGWETVFQTIKAHGNKLPNSTILMFGSPIDSKFGSTEIPIMQLGRINSNEKLKAVYSAMDILIMPSMMDAFGLIAQEAQSCGIPVICYSNTGVADVISSGKTGMAINNQSPEGLFVAIDNFRKNPELIAEMSKMARTHAKENWSYSKIGKQYLELYKQVSSDKGLTS
jgi:glycosyltransferase involved in cell wall biosynthesis